MKNKHSEAEKGIINEFKVELIMEVPPQPLEVPNEPIYEVIGNTTKVGEHKKSFGEWLEHVHEEVTAFYKLVKQ